MINRGMLRETPRKCFIAWHNESYDLLAALQTKIPLMGMAKDDNETTWQTLMKQVISEEINNFEEFPSMGTYDIRV